MKILVFNIKQFSYGILVLALVSSIVYNIVGIKDNLHLEVSKNIVEEQLLPIYGVSTSEKKIALTFDCAWENSDTEQLIDILNSFDIKATFFVTGDWCSRYPNDVKLFFDEGHAIENHSYSHPHVASIASDRLIADTRACDDIITAITGVAPTLYRAPYGEFSDSMLQVFDTVLSHKVIQWTADSRDWQGREAIDMAHTVISNITPGGIILFHNDTINTPQALEIIIPQLQDEGYEFVLVSDLILWEDYEINHLGLQITPC